MDFIARQLLIIRKAVHCSEPFPLTDKISVSVNRYGDLEFFANGCVYDTLAELQADYPECTVTDQDIQKSRNILEKYFDEEDGSKRVIYPEKFLSRIREDGTYYFEDCHVIVKGDSVTVKRY